MNPRFQIKMLQEIKDSMYRFPKSNGVGNAFELMKTALGERYMFSKLFTFGKSGTKNRYEI